MTDMAEQASLLLLSKLSSFLENPVIKLETAPTQEIVILQQQLKAMQLENDELRMEIKKMETRYADEVNRNLHLEDICRAHDFNWRRYW